MQGALLQQQQQQPIRGPLAPASQLLLPLTAARRSGALLLLSVVQALSVNTCSTGLNLSSLSVAGVHCRARLQSSSICRSSSSIQQPWQRGSFPPLPLVPTKQLQQQQRHRQQQQQQRAQQQVVRAAVEVWPSLKRRSRSK